MSELDIVRRIRKAALDGHLKRGLIKGIGDDCAVLHPNSGSDLVFTTDFVLEGRHFGVQTHSAAEVGRKALARSLSDLAAMGSEPEFCLVSLAIPPPLSSRWIDGFYRGLLGLAKKYKIALAGGDLSKFDKVIVDVMCCGRVPRGKAILRSGARPGDRIYVTGRLGRAAHSNWRAEAEPRIEAGIALRSLVSAGMDLSDGLSIDLHRLCTESGVSAEISSDLPRARGATLNEALHGGEDYELLLTARPAARIPEKIGSLPISQIGLITRGKPGQIICDGEILKLQGFDHFR